MEDSELRTITFKVSSEEAESLDAAVQESGLTRSDYIRQRLVARQQSAQPAVKVAETRDLTVLLHQVLFGLDRIYNAMHQMAGRAGALTAEQLDVIDHATARGGIDFLSNIDERIAKTRKRLAERLATAPPAAGK
ncbi:MAG TPA: hypothetical protein VHY56_14235 [Candidatus Binataceae bacterium]|jgi:hypothetical protein|nr:hypothetical protein [Candidatus Binataceae bacterium]